jgi:phosphate-selective porin OprO/OprP
MRPVLLLIAFTGDAAAQPEPTAAEPSALVEAPNGDAPSSVEAPAIAPVFDAASIDRIVDARIAATPETAGWGSEGFFVQTRDRTSRLKIGGLTQFDGRFFVAEANDPKVDQFGFRTIRPELNGTVLDHYDFRLLPDFAGGKLVLQDVHADVRYTDAIKLRFGKFKVPSGLERAQSDYATTFVERGLPSQLTPNRDLGVMVFGTLAGGVVAYYAGIFNGVADNASGDGDSGNAKEAAARVFVTPFASTDSVVKQLGFGAGGTYGRRVGTLADTGLPAYKTQGQTTFFAYRTGTTLMDTVIADGIQWRATAHASWYAGPLGTFAEYVRSVQHVALDGTHERIAIDSWQGVVQWVITGEDATFKNVAPQHPVDPSQGHWGAFDVAARVGELRVVDGGVFDTMYADPTKSARRVWSAGAGVDWFPNKTFRFVIDLERTWFRLGANDGDRPPETSIIGRAQTVF